MKRLFAAALMILLIAGCSQEKQPVSITVKNTSEHDLSPATITVAVDQLGQEFATVDNALVKVFDKEQTYYVPQMLDAEGDGTNDQLLFQDVLKSGEEKTYSVTLADAPGDGKAESVVYATYTVPRTDLAWENDKVAYRMYGPELDDPVLNGIDVLTKKVSYLVIDKWYHLDSLQGPEKVSYHEDHGEGADFFQVGSSLGAGSTGIWADGELYRPGKFSTYKIIASGPVRAVFELYYEPFNVNGMTVKETRRVTLDAGSNLNRMEVTYETEGAEEITVAAGLVTRETAEATENEDQAWLSLWGESTPGDPANGYTGTAVIFPEDAFTGFASMEDHFLITADATTNEPFVYCAGAGWTGADDFSSKEDWEAYLSAQAAKMNVSPEVTVVK